MTKEDKVSLDFPDMIFKAQTKYFWKSWSEPWRAKKEEEG